MPKLKNNDTEEAAEQLPKDLDYLFEKELINKQNKHIHIMDTFGPSRNSKYFNHIVTDILNEKSTFNFNER